MRPASEPPVLRSLQVKFSVLLVGLILIACLALAVRSTQHLRGALREEVEKRGEVLAEHLAESAKEHILLGEDLNLDSLVSLEKQRGAVAARVRKADGELLVEWNRGQPDGRRPETFYRPIYYRNQKAHIPDEEGTSSAAPGDEADPEGHEPTKDDAKRVFLGEAEVELDVDGLVAEEVRESASKLALAAFFVAVLGVLGGLAFVSLLIGPIRRLRAGVERLSKGDLTVRVPPTSRDEIGELTRAFNSMGESLQQKARLQNAFGRYVSDYVLTQLLESPEGAELAGVEREVTVFFADVRRFTRLSEGMKARDVVALLNQVFELVAARILAQGGTIDKFIGDSVMAYFGAPMPQADHAARAVQAALDIQRAVAERNRGLSAATPGASLRAVELGIGIHTGAVVVGNIGSDRRYDFTAIGDAVNVAHRLEKLARPGEILVSESVQRRVRGAVRLRFEGERQLSGRLEPVHVYSLELSEPAGVALSS